MDIDSLKQMFDMHIKECDGRDERNVETNRETKEMVKGIWNAIDIMRTDLTKLQLRLAMGIGALIVIAKAIDWFVEFHK